MNWHTKELLDRVLQRHGAAQMALLEPALSSFAWKLFIAQYHAEESRTAIARRIASPSDREYVEIIRLILQQAAGAEEGASFALAQFQAEAHMIAYAQSLHSLADILSQVIYYSLNLDKYPSTSIEQRRRNLHAVSRSLDTLSRFKELYESIEELRTSSQFQYLNAYVNTTKHRSLVAAKYSVSLQTDAEPFHGFKLSEFEYEGSEYPPKYSNELFDDDFSFIRDSFIEIGNKVNRGVSVS